MNDAKKAATAAAPSPAPAAAVEDDGTSRYEVLAEFKHAGRVRKVGEGVMLDAAMGAHLESLRYVRKG